MKNFTYKAKNGPDEVLEGVMLANNKQEVVDKLASQGLVATYVESQQEDSPENNEQTWRNVFSIRLKDKLIFTRQLSKLLASGIPILRALAILSEQTQNKYFRSIIDDLGEKVKNGESLSVSIAKYPNVFSSFYIAMVRAGEDSGQIGESLARISHYYAKQHELISKVKAALVYPLLILVVGIATLIFIFTNVIPNIIPILLGLKVSLPFPTRLLIAISSFAEHNWFGILLWFLIGLLIFKRALANQVFKLYVSRLKLRLPIFGELIFKSEFSRFARALETALKSGVPIISAIALAVPILNEESIKTNLESSLKELESGGSFGNALKKTNIFPAFVSNFICIGEESGKLGDALSEISGFFESDCEECVKVLTTMLEPLMILIIGLIVGFIVSAVLLPIFQLNFMQL